MLALLAGLLGFGLFAGCVMSPERSTDGGGQNAAIANRTQTDLGNATRNQSADGGEDAEENKSVNSLKFVEIMWPNKTYADSHEITIDSEQFRRHGSVWVKLDAPPSFFENATDPVWQQSVQAEATLPERAYYPGASVEVRVLIMSLDNRTLVNQTVPDLTAWRFTDPKTGEEYEFGISNMNPWRVEAWNQNHTQNWKGYLSGSAWFYIDQISLNCNKDWNRSEYQILMPGDSLASDDGYGLIYHSMDVDARRIEGYKKIPNLTILDPQGHGVRGFGYGGDIDPNGRFVFCPSGENNLSDLRLYAKGVRLEHKPAYCILNATSGDPVQGYSIVDYMDNLSYDGLEFRYEGNFWSAEHDPPLSAAEIRVVDSGNRTLGTLEVPEFSQVDWTDPSSGKSYEVKVCQYDHEHGWGIPGSWAALYVSGKQ